MLNLLVLFGSTSDKTVYNPLLEKLKKKHFIDFKILSAHRNPNELDTVIKADKFQAVIAGAGLAAHLPGVVASKTQKPVFGIPVKAAFGGIDAFSSIIQMPFGVPVLACFPERINQIVSFLNLLDSRQNSSKTIHLVVEKHILNEGYVVYELERTKGFAKKENIDLKIVHEFDESYNNVVLTNSSKNIYQNKFCIHVPVLDKKKKSEPAEIFSLFEFVKQGGLWVGVNNTRNALILMNQIFNC